MSQSINSLHLVSSIVLVVVVLHFFNLVCMTWFSAFSMSMYSSTSFTTSDYKFLDLITFPPFVLIFLTHISFMMCCLSLSNSVDAPLRHLHVLIVASHINGKVFDQLWSIHRLCIVAYFWHMGIIIFQPQHCTFWFCVTKCNIVSNYSNLQWVINCNLDCDGTRVATCWWLFRQGWLLNVHKILLLSCNSNLQLQPYLVYAVCRATLETIRVHLLELRYAMKNIIILC